MSTMFSIFALFSVTIPNTLSTDYALMCQAEQIADSLGPKALLGVQWETPQSLCEAEKSYPGDNAIKLVFVGLSLFRTRC